MIKNKLDLKEYLLADKKALGKMIYRKPRFKHDIIWKYQILLRKCEYYINCRKDFLGRLYCKFLKFRFMGFSIPFNVFGKGLSIAHYGNIVVNNNSKIGINCRIHEGVTIGVTDDAYWGEQCGEAPVIGDNVFIATGAKIIGNVKIADGVAIGANAVVVKDILEPNTTWGGVPAKRISNNGSKKYIRETNESSNKYNSAGI